MRSWMSWDSKASLSSQKWPSLLWTVTGTGYKQDSAMWWKSWCRVDYSVYTYFLRVSLEYMCLQVGSVHSYVPQIAYQYFAESDPSYWQQLTCPGLNSYITKLESILLPHLSKRSVNPLAETCHRHVHCSHSEEAGRNNKSMHHTCVSQGWHFICLYWMTVTSLMSHWNFFS